MKLARSKKGVSPLITTILLIAFAVALGVVVMNWGRTTANKIGFECPDEVSIKISELKGKPNVCIDQQEKTIRITLENGPAYEVVQIFGQAITDNDVFQFTMDKTMKKREIHQIVVDYDPATYGKVNKLTLIPYVYIYDSMDISDCADNVFEKEFANGVPDC
ncbi:hypothetical protein K9M79_04210 [Candidatus Woesearchaeota archaeon]|nr:hypothetical protein [Candidatus Woesearchaeota archaeon]